MADEKKPADVVAAEKAAPAAEPEAKAKDTGAVHVPLNRSPGGVFVRDEKGRRVPKPQG